LQAYAAKKRRRRRLIRKNGQFGFACQASGQCAATKPQKQRNSAPMTMIFRLAAKPPTKSPDDNRPTAPLMSSRTAAAARLH